MSICSSSVVRNRLLPLPKPRTVLVLDHSNIKFSAMNRGKFVNLRRMVQELSETFTLVHKMAFVQPNGLKAVAFLEGLGFEVFIRPYNADSLIGIKVRKILGSDIDTIIICSMDGGFASIEEEASEGGVEVYYVGFQDGYSHLLREESLIPLESLGCIERAR